MTPLQDTYRAWLTDADAYQHDRIETGGWWTARADTDAYITADGRLFIDDEEVQP
jgi:hypothetical protein